MSKFRRMWPDEIAATLKARDDEIDKLRRKLHKAKQYVQAYTLAPRSQDVINLRDGVLDIIDNAYEEEKKA